VAVNGLVVDTIGYDNARSGANTKETILNTGNVNAAKFGLLFSRTIVGASYGQPLYVSGVTINGAKRNVVYVATVENNVYAFDAEAPSASAPLWQKNLGGTLSLVSGFNPGCLDMSGSNSVVGITSTPVISVADGKLFLVAKGPDNHKLHALDLATGAQAAGSPAAIGAGMADFDSNHHLNRTGLLLANGVIYVGFGSHCDKDSYHGWVFGYDSKTLQKTASFNTTPAGNRGAIWQSGAGLATDGTDVFAVVGNGNSGGTNYGQNILGLKPGATMSVAHSFVTPTAGDNDLQTGALVLGDEVLAGGKDGDLYVLGKADFKQRQKIGLGGHLHWLASWNGSAGQMVYTWVEGSGLRAFKVTGGALGTPVANDKRKPSHPGGIFTVSSNGATAGTGIVWASVPAGGDAWHGRADGSLMAFDAADITKPVLWDSTVAPADDVPSFAKFSPPMVANGRVYLATFSGKLQVYGLK